ncbi:MAG TPA: glycosyltransferase family 39 protein, partial [Cytophagaceae bacterium]|nr:glycosyltransferase family 39 protein [Cytophagaceae bacterium]
MSEKFSFKIQHLLVLWFLINVLSAYFTELGFDESYYWMYSRFPAWGYFDHPPAIMVMDLLGYAFLKNELGVRLISILMSTVVIYYIYKLSEPENIKIFSLFVLSCFPIHLFGFFSLPDVPLLFFTVLFFVAYDKFLKTPTILHTLILTIIMSLLVYSKYHGVLVIFFTILSNPRLLIQRKFIIAGLLSFALFLPHLYWQYTHDFISFRFHLFQRASESYSPWFTINYIFGQPLYYGPLMGFVLFYFTFKSAVTN